MKSTRSLLLFAFMGLVIFGACKDKNDDDKKDSDISDNAYVNKWMYNQMDEWYLWRDQMPNESNVNWEASPETFFANLLYGKESRFEDTYFSTIESNHNNLPKTSASSVSAPSLGFEYIPKYTDNSNTTVAFIVVYVHKQTNAEVQGLKRGHVILNVDGQTITPANYLTIMTGQSTRYTLNVRDYTLGKDVNLTITPTPNFTENPIYLDTIYTEGSKKIGYLVYNLFEFGSTSTRTYDVQLAKKLDNFRQKGITDLVLDLRYNPGGYVTSAQTLCSALVPNRSTRDIFNIKSYNSVKQAQIDAMSSTTRNNYLYDYFVDNVTSSGGGVLTAIPKLGDQLNSLYVLGTVHTASASELIINALRAYRPVVLVGERTTGKNIGGWALYEDNDTRNTYAISPIIFKIYNKNNESDYASGMTPDIYADDFATLNSNGGIRPLGDRNETMLNVAIAAIMGRTPSVQTRSTGASFTKLPGSSIDRKRNAYKLLELKKMD